MMKAFFGVLFFSVIVVSVRSQISIAAVSTTYSQNFDGMGSSATAALPSGFVVSSGSIFSAGTSATGAAAGTTGAGVLTSTSSGAVYNFANGITASATDRSLGFLTSSSFSSPRTIMLQIVNNTGSTLTSLNISFDYEKYRSGSRAFDWLFYHGSDGASWASETAGNQSYTADAANTTVYNPPTAASKSFSVSGLSILNGSVYYLRWTFTGSGGSTNGQAIGIDNFSVSATSTPITLSNSTDHFRSKQNGDWGVASTWESSGDGSSWINSTLIPTNLANTITIKNTHTVTIVNAVTADQLTIESGAVLNHSTGIAFSINDNSSGTDMIINGTYVINGEMPSGSGTYIVNSGGIIRADDNTGSNSDNIAFLSNLNCEFKTGSIFQWNTTDAFETIGIEYFRNNNGAEKPIFRISQSPSIGSNSQTNIYGLLEVTASLTWNGTGAKYFRDGITGTGNITQASSGTFYITGTDAELGGSGAISLNSGGLQIASAANVTLSSNKTINGNTYDFTVADGARLNCSTFVISGGADFILASGGTLGIGSADGITSSGVGNIQTSTRTYSSGANYIYNGSTNQLTGNFTTTPVANTVNTFTIANTGTTGNRTVTLTVNNTTATALYLNNGLFASGTNQTLRIASGGNIYGNGANNPNDASAGNIEFLGNGTTQGYSTGNPFLYSVILNSGGVDFNGVTTHSATIMNRLQLNTGAYVSDAPYYQTGSSLVYNTGGTYGRNVEWGSLSNQGYPYNVTVQGGTVLNLNTNAISPSRLEIAGTLTIGNANGSGQVYLNNGMQVPLSVLGNLVIGSTDAASNGSVLQLSTVIGGDLWLNGDFTRYSNGSYNDNSRAVFFKGSVSSSINTPNTTITAGVPTQNFSYLLMEKDAASNILTLNCPVGITGQITLTTGVITTSTTNLLVIESSAVSTTGSVSSFVNGPVRKKGGTAFTFPTGVIVGSEYHHRTIGITATGDASSSYTAMFYRADSYLRGAISNAAKTAGLQRVSRCEYWSLTKESGTNAGVELTWTTQSPCNVGYVTQPSTIVAVQFNGTQWGDTFGGTGIGTAASGSVTWTGGPSIFNYFTLGSTDFNENPLPFDLSTFKATARKTDVVLDWSTSTNNEQVEFVVEKSRNNFAFDVFRKISAKSGTALYAYTEVDEQPFSGWNYYRLRTIDNQGRQQLSAVSKVWVGSGQQIRISPNPASEKIVINFSEPSSISEIDIVNISGQVLKHISTVQFSNEINISHLQAGMYYVRIMGKNGLTTSSFIKQ
ncbi:T9SS type A sorting domain-containing protein [Lacibacter luteus]|uniref:T9SS type A sorting domain-containing protein n=1 Tax=Lacibacter luteus TaxID=2508719 RepID=A0A4Q1CGM8_9BACT|nr:T9SS type A sorting domain-containing protein [Lacibacter luteus]RXK59305.1 T9SS type A sorting domain-containing protein [Lacibacter luteus]